MTWTLAHNLKARLAAVDAVWPTMTIFTIGDQTHQAECSDHNPDARGIVHAIDIMTETDQSFDGAVSVILPWLLSSTADLQYVIHDRKIWSRTNAFIPKLYDGTDPHTNHIHVSGRHGTVGANAATCTGYDAAAEDATPEGIDIMTAEQLATLVAEIRKLPGDIAVALESRVVDAHGVTLAKMIETVTDNTAKIVANTTPPAVTS